MMPQFSEGDAIDLSQVEKVPLLMPSKRDFDEFEPFDEDMSSTKVKGNKDGNKLRMTGDYLWAFCFCFYLWICYA